MHFILQITPSCYTLSKEFNSRIVILFQIEVFVRNIKEATLVKYFIKATAPPIFR